MDREYKKGLVGERSDPPEHALKIVPATLPKSDGGIGRANGRIIPTNIFNQLIS